MPVLTMKIREDLSQLPKALCEYMLRTSLVECSVNDILSPVFKKFPSTTAKALFDS